MSDINTYRPSNEFREHLEWEVRTRFRRTERRRALARSTRWAKAAAIVGVSVAIGTTAGFASAQIRQNAGRDSLLAAARAEAGLAKLRLDLARAQADDVSLKVRVGAVDQQQLANATADLADMQAKMNRAGLNIEEITASGRAPSDDLNAPLVDGRDFVKQRIQVELMAVQQRLRAAESSQMEAERRARVGMEDDASQASASAEMARAKARMSVLAKELELRTEFLSKGTAVEDLAQRLNKVQLTADAFVAQEELKTAQARLALIEKRRAAGTADDVELLRARLDVKEREVELQKIARRLQTEK